MESTTRWMVTVSKETDIALRSLLAQRGLKKGDLSKFIEEAVKWRVFDRTVSEARRAFDDMSSDKLDSLVEEALTASKRKKAKKPAPSKRRRAQSARKN